MVTYSDRVHPPQLADDDPPFQDLVLSVFHLSNVLSASGDRLVADLGLTSARWQILGALSAGAPRPVAWLARDLDVSRQNVQRIVNDLERDGFVTFQPNPHHRRAQLVTLTPEGEAVLAAAAARAAPWAGNAAAGLDPADVDTARRVLHAIGTAVQAHDTHSRPKDTE
jgi:DNA-binding MarR family transcriptional regulator